MKTKFNVLLTFLLALVVQLSFAQEKTVKGKVSDVSGALPGVSVVIKGTSSGTQTDFDGNYAIKAKAGDVLQFSYMGMKTSYVTVGASNTINVTMKEDAQSIGEVVVTAMGISREEKKLAYSAPKVKADEITAAQNTNAVSALSGKVAGLKVNSPSGNLGGSQRILVRGTNSVTGENQPLFVIDGIPMDNSNFNTTNTQRGGGGIDFGSTINDIDPNNIESVTVLKGAAAALYGSRASNGVIVITTKKGSKSDKLGVTVNSSVSFSKVAILPKLQREYGGGSYISDEDGGKNGFAVATINGKEYMLVDYKTDESWGPKYNPNLKVLHWDAFDKESFPEDYLKPRAWVAPKNDVDSFFNTGVSVNNSVTVTKGSEEGNYLLSIGDQKTTGILPGTEIKKHFAKVTISQKLGEKLTANGTLNYVKTSGIRPEIGYSGNSVTQKFFQWGQRQLDYGRLKKYKNLDGTQRTWNRISWDDARPNYSDNPYWTANENKPSDTRSRIYGTIGATYQITDELSVKGSIYADTYSFRNSERIAVGSQSQSSYLERAYNFKEYNFEAVATYNKKINDNLRLTALAGLNSRDNKLDYRFMGTTGGLSVPGIYNINNGKGPLNKNSYTSLKKVNSVFGSLNLELYNQVFVDLTARNDWSSTLPDATNSYFYPSAAVAWEFTKNIESKNILNYGKLRFGWAQVGNDASPYKVTNTLSIGNPFNGGGRVSVPGTLLNENLKNETTTTWEVGAQLNFLENRVNLDVTYYNNKTTDQIIPVNLSYGTGYGAKWINAGEMTNKGIEVELGLSPIKKENFSWDVNFNFAKNQNKVVNLDEGLESILLTNAPFRVSLVALKGKPYGTIMGTDFIRDSKGNKVVRSNGRYAATSDLVSLGSVLPDYTAGMKNSFKYKNFDLGFLIEMSKGGKYFSTSYQWGMFSGMLQETVANNIREDGIVLPGVTGTITQNDDGSYTVTDTKPNDKKISAGLYGALHYGAYGSPDAQSVFDASYFKLREITLGYTFDKNLLGFFDNARVSIFGRNLLTWGLDYKGIDPETVSTGSGNIQGLEGGLQPSVKTYGINFKFSF